MHQPNDAHVSLNQFQSLVYICFRFPLVLFHQDGADEFVHLVFWSQLSELLRNISGASHFSLPVADVFNPHLLDHLILLQLSIESLSRVNGGR